MHAALVLLPLLAPLALSAQVASPSGGTGATTESRGVALFDAGRMEEARAVFEELLGRGPSAVAHHYLGRIALEGRDFDAARDHLERAAQEQPADPEHRYWLGMACLEDLRDASIFRARGLAGCALGALEEAVELDPDHVEARAMLAEYYLRAPGIGGGDKRKALRHASELVSRDRRRGYVLTSMIHAGRGDEEMARIWWEATLRAFPDDPEVGFQAGMYHQEAERWDEASAAFERVAAMPVDAASRPWVRQALYQVGRTGVLSKSRTERGVEALRTFSERFAEPEDELTAGAHWRLGMLQELRGDLDAARRAYEAALAVDPDHDEAASALGRLR